MVTPRLAAMTSLSNMESKSLIFRRAAQGFLSDVYKNKYTSEKIASMTPKEQTPHTPQICDAVYTKQYIRSKSASMIRVLQTPPHRDFCKKCGERVKYITLVQSFSLPDKIPICAVNNKKKVLRRQECTCWYMT